MICSSCGRQNPSRSAFCGYCGQPFTSPLTAPATTSLDELSGLKPYQGSAVPQQAPAADERAGGWPAGRVEAPPRTEVPPGGEAPPRSAETPRTNGAAARASASRSRDTAATRYLCAAVSLDEALRQRVVQDVLEEEHRAVVTTPGVDLVAVLKYALAAHRRQVIRDVVLLVLLVLLVVLFFILGSLGVLACLVAAWVTVCVERYASSRGVARELRADTFRPDKVPQPGRSTYAARQLDRIAAAGTTGNVSVYSTFPPFVGYGEVRSSWSFTVDITQARQTDRVRSFSVQEVYEHLHNRLSELDFPGMTVGTRVFIDGHDIAGDKRFLPDPGRAPVTSISAGLVADLMARPEERARPYLSIGLTSWQGDLVTTQFIRFLLSRSDLFVESAHTVMPPLRPEFKAIDEQDPDMQPGEFFALLGGGVISTIPRLLGSIRRLARELGADGRREKKRLRVERAGDYGALLSVRESAARRGWDRYFQVLDDARFTKVIQQRIFRALTEFLEAHGIDAAELKSKTDIVVNSGVMVTGGTVSVGAMAAGENAHAEGGIAAQVGEMASRLRSGAKE